jgi:hypothetical protein
MQSRNFKTPKIRNMRCHKNKETQRGPQQTSKETMKRRICELKRTTRIIKE